MENYNARSVKPEGETASEQPERKKLDKVASGTVRKKSAFKKAMDVFFAEDLETVKTYLISDVLIPELRDAIYNMFRNGLEMLFYPGSKPGKPRNSNIPRVSYNKIYLQNSPGSNVRVNRSSYDFDSVEFETRGEAEEVLNSLVDLIDSFGLASVADFYDLSNLQANYTDNKYGWTSLGAAEVKRTSNGSYIIKLPKAIQL